jgi:hypothetical protein
MTLFGKLRSFAAWHETNGHLESAVAASSKKRSQYNLLGGAALTVVAGGEPEPLCAYLSSLCPILDQFYRAQTQSDSYFPGMASHVAKLPVLHEDVKAKAKYTDSLRQRSADHASAYSQASRRLEQLKQGAQNRQAAIGKARDQCEIALRQHHASLTAVEEQEARYTADVRENKGLVVSAVLRALEQFAVAKARASGAIGQSALNVRRAAEQIRPFDDRRIETLMRELTALREEAEETTLRPIGQSPSELPNIRPLDEDSDNIDDLND